MLDPADVLRHLEAEARREPFPVDAPVYADAGRDPQVPLLWGGRLEAPVAFVARDLGRDEVHAGEPLIGAAGRLVRAGLHRAGGGAPEPAPEALAIAAQRALLTNTVPYKPPGNKAYSQAVRRRFRPFLAALLTGCWQGATLITLGNEAFGWFKPYGEAEALAALWDDPEQRYTRTVEVELVAEWAGRTLRRAVTLAPLPHPSPLNARWYGRFPELLDARLAAL